MLAHARVVVREAVDDLRDEIADAIVVADEIAPSRRRSPSAPSRGRRRSRARCAACRAAGVFRPREALTKPIEFSTVTNCSPDFCTSRSVRPRHGRMSARSPGDEVRSIELGRDLHGERAPLEPFGRRARCPATRRGSCRRSRRRRARGPRASPRSRRRCRSRARAAARTRTRAERDRGTRRACAPRCPSCDRPARSSARAPGTGPRRADRCCRARA